LGINVKKQILLGGIMRCSHLVSFANPRATIGPDRSALRAAERVLRGPGGKRVAGLEKPRTSIICGQQGEKRPRDKNGVPIPRQVVTHAVGGLSIADIALQHSSGSRWQWHRRKSKGSATVRTEVGEARWPR
jgi:hypothetical protein